MRSDGGGWVATEGPAQSEQPPHVLATEDDPAVRGLLVEVLEGEGYRVSLSTAQDVTQVARLAPDLVLLDFRVAGAGGGWGFLERLKAHPATAALPVLVLTTAAREADEQADRFRDMDVAMMRKPFDVDGLLVEIGRRLTGERA